VSESSASISDQLVWAYGTVLPAHRAGVTVLDRAYLYGDAVFETLKTIDHAPVFADQHIARLLASARELRFANVPKPEEIRAPLDELVARSPQHEQYLRIALSRGRGTPSPRLRGTFRPILVIFSRPLKRYPDELYQSGMRVAFAPWRRSKSSPMHRHKTCNYLESILAQDAVRPGAHEALFLNCDGEVAECAASNIFHVSGGTLVTPEVRANLLPGIVRANVLALAPSLGLKVQEKTVLPLDLFSADEIFLTNSLMGVMPVQSVEGHKPTCLQTGEGWPQTLRIAEAFGRLERESAAGRR
jgi:aminodeoxychorismate lyase